MDEGLFFWMIILAVAVLQGISQRKKKPGQQGQEQPGQPRPRSPGQRIPSQDGPPTVPPAQREGIAASSGQMTRPTGPGGRGEAESSADMIPADVWAEILGLARGEPKAKAEKPVAAEEEETGAWQVSKQASEVREERPRRDAATSVVKRREEVPAPQARAFPVSHGADAVLHQTQSGDVQSRLAVARFGAPRSEGEGIPDGGATVKDRLFGSGSTDELRKAIILSEVLGPPLGLRE